MAGESGAGMAARTEEALRRTDAAGIARWVADPPYVRLLRRMGLGVRPPHYAPFWANVMGHGVVFTFAWGILMWLVAWGGRVPAAPAAVAALFAGLAFGLVVAFLYRATAERCGLGRWEELPAR